MNEKNGITLLALVITVVIIILLATVSINFLFGEDGIVTRAEEAKEMMNIESVREELEMAKASEIAEGKGKVDIDDYLDNITNAGIAGNVEDKGDGSYEVTTDEGFIFEVTPVPDKDNAEDIEIEYVGEATGPRITEITAEITTNSAKITVEVSNAEKAKYTYEYKKEGEENWQTAENGNKIDENTCKIEKLEDNEIYNLRITVEVTSGVNAGTTTRQTSIKTGEMPEGAITFGTPEWQGDGTANVIVNTSEEGYTMQYQIVAKGSVTNPEDLEEAQWQEVGENNTITGIEYNETTYARLWDGHNGGSYANVDVEDDITPQKATISLSSTSVTTGSTVRATVTHNDNESGPEISKCKYVWNTSSTELGTDESLYTGGTFTSNGQQISRTMSSAGNYYLHVLTVDKAGNKVETVSNRVNAYVYVAPKYYRWKKYNVVSTTYMTYSWSGWDKKR